MPFTIVRQDITKMHVDAIVNAANTDLLMGGGVCGAIFQAAGADALQAACHKLAPIRTGEAAITPAFALPCKFIVHAAGPVYRYESRVQCEKLLRGAYFSSLHLAAANGCKSIAFPLISSGIYGYPKDEALRVATAAIRDFLAAHDMTVYLALFDKAASRNRVRLFGAIIGDIVGSVYEWHNIKTKDFPLFREDCFFTDDTVMTVATAEALMNGGSADDFIDAYKKYGRAYPNAGYGGRFGAWVNADDRKPYQSWGNGAAMRISPCGWIMDCGFYARTGCWPSDAWDIVTRAAAVTHNHSEGIKGAQATAMAIFFGRFYSENYGAVRSIDELKKNMKELIERTFGYNLSRTLEEIRPSYRFDESCQNTVPQAIIAFLESTDFEDAIRNAISLGGDSDTLAAITGSIAEAAYGIPQWIMDKAWDFLDEPLRDTCRRWQAFIAAK